MTDWFEEACPHFLAIGMTYNQYWYGDPEIAAYYLKAKKLRREEENNNMHRQYLYDFHVLHDIAPLLHAFPKKGVKVAPSLEEPLPLTAKQAQEQAQRRYNEKVKRFTERAEAINAKRKGGE